MKSRYAVYLSLLVLSIVSAAKMQNIFGRMPLCLNISIFMFSAVYAVAVYRRFSFSENSEDKVCTRGQSFHYSFRIVNDTALFFPHISAVFFNGYEKIKEDLAVKPHEAQTIELYYPFKHIGKYDIGFINARVYGLLNIFFIPYRNYRHEVLVIPRIDDASGFTNVKRDDEARQSFPALLKKNNCGNFDGVRSYVPGDDLKRIHWKLTAHTGKYMSRLSETSDSLEISIFIDLYKTEFKGETALSIFDAVIESALSMANYSIKQNYTVHIVFNRQKQIIVKTINDFITLRKIAEDFALYGFDASGRVENLLSGCQYTDKGSFNFAVCTPNLNYDLAYYMAWLRSLGGNPLLFYIVPQAGKHPNVRKITEYLEDSGVDVREITV